MSNDNAKQGEASMAIPKIKSMTEFRELEPEFFMPGYLVKGGLNIIAGDGGSGKTTCVCGIIAGASSGQKIFFDPTPEGAVQYEQRKVLFLNAEDSPEYGLRAKLRKSGANLDKVSTIDLKDEGFNSVKFGTPVLEEIVIRERPALVVFDPIQSFLPPGANMAQRNEMRNCLNQLLSLGERHRCTFIVVVHTNKRTGAYGRYRISDSSDIWDIARSVLIVGKTQDGQHYVSHEKSSYCKQSQTAIFSIEDGVAVFEEYSDKRDEDFVTETRKNDGKALAQEDAQRFICDCLKDGEMQTAELDSIAEGKGFSKRTLQRAKADLKKNGILGYRNKGYGGNKAWATYLIQPESLS